MTSPAVRESFSALCQDGRLIPTGNGSVFFHPYPMDTPVDLVGLVQAMNAPREAGPAFHMSHEGLLDVGALHTAQRVVHDLTGSTGGGLRIATAPVNGTERTAIGSWQQASDVVGVPVGAAHRPWMETSPRVVRVDGAGRPDPAGGFVRVLPKGLAALRAVLRSASRLEPGPPWDRLRALAADAAAHRDALRVPDSGRIPGAPLWQAGYQLAAGMALGLPGPDAPDAVTPISVAELRRLWGDPARVPVRDPAALAEDMIAEPGSVALVHHEPRAGTGPGELRLLVSHDGALWWVDLAAAPAEAVRAFDPADPRQAGALTGFGTTVRPVRARVPAPAPAPPAAPVPSGPAPEAMPEPPPGPSPDETPPASPPTAPATARPGPSVLEPSFAPKSGLVDALLDPDRGRQAAGMLTTRPRPRPPEGSGITTGPRGPEALIQAEYDAVAADLRGSDARRQFDAVDDLLRRRLVPVRDRFAADRARHEAARVAAETAIAGHDAEIARLTGDVAAHRDELRTALETAAALTRRREDGEAELRARWDEHRDAAGAAARAQRAAAASVGLDPAARRRLGEAAQDAAREVARLAQLANGLERRVRQLRMAEDAAAEGVSQVNQAIARDTAAGTHQQGLRELRVLARDRAVTDRDQAGADRTLVEVHLDYLRSLASDWAGLEFGDMRRTAGRVDEVLAPGSPVRALYDDASAEVTAILGRGAAVTPAEAGRLAYLAHLDRVRERVESAHRADPAWRAHILRTAAHAKATITAPEADLLAGRADTLRRWTALADAFEEARKDAADRARTLLDQPGADLGPLLDGITGPAARRARLPETAGHAAGLSARVELVNAPSAPWFLREKHLLGDGYVRQVNGPAEPGGIARFSRALTADVAARIGTSRRPWRSVRGDVESWLDAQLADTDAKHWESLIESGAGRDFNGRFVRVHVRPVNPVYQPRPDLALKPGDSNMHIKGGDVSYGRTAGGGTGWGLPFFAAVFFATANEAVRFAIGPIARFFVGGSRRWSESAGGAVQAENMIFTGDFATHQFGADAEVVLEIDGQEEASRPLPGHLVLAMPKLLSSARDGVDPASVGLPTRATNPAALLKQDFAVSAAGFEDPLQELQTQLRQHPDFQLSAKHAARVVDKLRREMMGQRGAKDSNQWWTTNSWLSPHVSMKVGKWRRLDGHLRTGGRLVDLRRVTDTTGLIRNDMAAIATRGAARGGGSTAGRRIGAEPPVLLGEHLVLPRWDVGFLNTSRNVNRSVGFEASARSMPTRKAKLVRYMATVAAELTFDSSRGQLEVQRNTTVEIAVPEPYADAFEQQVMATPALREVFSRPDDPVVTIPKPSRKVTAFPKRGARTPADLRKIADRHRIEVSFPGAVNPGGQWAWLDTHPRATIRDLDATDFSYPDVESVPALRYAVDPANPLLILGATVFTRGTVHRPGEQPRTDIVSAEFVRNPALPRATRPAPGTPATTDAVPPPFGRAGVRNAFDLWRLARTHPIEVAVAGRSGAAAPARIEDLPAALHTLWPARDAIRLRGDGDYTYGAGTPADARYRYLVDDRGLVTAAIPLGGAEDTGTRTPGDPVPNPALHLPTRPAGPVTPEHALVEVRKYLDGLTGYTQVQLGAGVPGAVQAALAGHPLVELLDRTGNRVAGQTLPPMPMPDGTTRSVVQHDGWLHRHLPPLSGPTREPWALASRSGLGPGTLKEIPGAELIFSDLLVLVEHQMRAVGLKLSGEERQERLFELAAKFGVPGMRGSQRSLFDTGITDSFTVGKYTFHVDLVGILDDLIEIRTVPDYWIDNRVISKGTTGVSESLTRSWGTRVDLSARLAIQDFFGVRVRLARLVYGWDRKRGRNAGQNIAGGRRRKVGGLVTELVYGTRYQLNVTVTDRDGKLVRPSSSRAYGGEGFETPVHVAEEDLAPVPAPQPESHGITPVDAPPPPGPGPLLTRAEAVSRLSAAEADDMGAWLAGQDVTGGAGGLVSAVRDGIDGMFVWLNRVEGLARTVQSFVDAVDGHIADPVGKGSLDELLRDLAPGGDRQTLEPGVATGITPDFLEPIADHLMSGTGGVVPLDRKDGAVRQLRVHLVPANARYSHPTDAPSTKDYALTGVSAGASTTTGRGLRVMGGTALFVQTGKGAAGLDEPDRDIPPTTRLADNVNVSLLDASASRHTGVKESVQTGGKEGTRASYEGRSFTHSADALFLVTYERYIGGELWSSTIDLKIKNGIETSTPYARAERLGLPVPAGDMPVVPAQTRPLRPVHPEVSYATSHVEELTAAVTGREPRTTIRLRDDRPVRVTEVVTVRRDVLRVVLDNLAAMKVDVGDPTISGAVTTLFRDSALKRHYRTIRKEGVFQVITLNRAHGGVRRIGIRLTARDGALEYERPRPDAKTTISGVGLTVVTEVRSKDNSFSVGSNVDGRFLAGDARVVFGAEAEYERESSSAVARSGLSQAKHRGGPLEAGSHQFGADTRFTVEFLESSALPQALQSTVDAAAWTVKVVDTLTDGRLRARLQSWFPATKAPARSATVDGHLSILTPAHLTRNGPPRPVPGAGPLPETLDDLPPATVRMFDGPGGTLPADLTADLARTEALAGHLFGLETFQFDAFARWLPMTRQAGAERYDVTADPARLADYGPLSTVTASMTAALSGENSATHIGEMMTGRFVVSGDGGDEFTVRAVLRQGRWLTRGGYDASHALLHAEELEAEQEKSSGFSVAPLETGAGPATGNERSFVGTGLGVGRAGGGGSGSAVSGYAVDIERRKGDHDYIWFDVTLIGTSKNKRSWIRGDVPYGLLARIPSGKAAEVFGPAVATMGVLDQALRHGLADGTVVPYPDRRFLLDELAKERVRSAPNLLRQAELDAAVRRALDWTAAVQMAPRSPADPAPPPEDCVVRAFGLFVTVHRRTTNVTTDADAIGHRTADDLVRALGGEFLRLRDPDTLREYLRHRPGTMVAVRTPPPDGGMSHLWWVMSVGGGRLRVFDGQEHGVSATDADLGTRRQALTDGLTTTHQRLFHRPGTEVVLLDERGRAVDLREAVPGAVTVRQPGDRRGRRESGRLPSTVPLAGVEPVHAAEAPVKRPPAEPIGQDRVVRTLGDFSGPDARRTLARIRDAVRHTAGGPVVAINLSGPADPVRAAVRQLDHLLRHDGWRGRPSIVAATLGTRATMEAFDHVRLSRGVVAVREGMAGFDRVWQLLEPGAVNPSAMEPAPNASLLRLAGALTPPGGETLTPVLADWIAHTGWDEAEAFQRANDARLRAPGIAGELRGVVGRHAGDLRLRGFLILLEVAGRAGGIPAADAPRLTPAVSSFLGVEPGYDAGRGPVPVTFLYDYLRAAGGARRERFPLDGVLFQLVLAGQLTHAETTALARLAAVHRPDGANARVFEVVTQLLGVPDAELAAHPTAVTARFQTMIGAVSRVGAGTPPEDCLDPVDRTAWVGRLDFLRDRLRSSGDPAAELRAQVVEVVTYTLSNC